MIGFDKDRKAINYVRKMTKKFDDEKVRNAMLSAGYTNQRIEEIFEKALPKRTKFVSRTESSPHKAEVFEEGKKGLRSELEEIKQKLELVSTKEDKKIEKQFGLPGKIKRGLKKAAIKDKILVIYLKKNKVIMPIIERIQNDFVVINGKPHNISLDFVFLWKGKHPAIVVPEWDLNPIGTNDYYEALEDGRDPYAVSKMIKMLEAGEDLGKKKISPMMIIWGLIGAAVLFYVFAGNN